MTMPCPWKCRHSKHIYEVDFLAFYKSCQVTQAVEGGPEHLLASYQPGKISLDEEFLERVLKDSSGLEDDGF